MCHQWCTEQTPETWRSLLPSFTRPEAATWAAVFSSTATDACGLVCLRGLLALFAATKGAVARLHGCCACNIDWRFTRSSTMLSTGVVHTSYAYDTNATTSGQGLHAQRHVQNALHGHCMQSVGWSSVTGNCKGDQASMSDYT